MDSIFMISGNSKTSNLHRLLVNLSDKTNLKQCNEYVAFLNLSICYILKKLKAYETYKFKISAPTWNAEFELPFGSYAVSDIQDNFDYIIKKYETMTGNPSIRIYVNKIESMNTFRIKIGYYVKLLRSKTMKLLGSDKNG